MGVSLKLTPIFLLLITHLSHVVTPCHMSHTTPTPCDIVTL